MFSSPSPSQNSDSCASTGTSEPRTYSFEALCVPHYRDMMNFALRLAGGDRARAGDVVQTAYVKALIAWERWTPEGDITVYVRAWLYRIVANTYLKDYRSASRAAKRAATLVMETTLATLGRLGDDGRVTVDSAYGDEVTEALAQLSDDHKEIIEAFYLCDFGVSEVAEVLGLAKGTVFSRLARAHGALEHLLGDFADAQYGLKRVKPRADRKVVRDANASAANTPRTGGSGGGVHLRKPSQRVHTKTACIECVVGELDQRQFARR